MSTLPVIANTFRCSLGYRDSGGATAANVFHLRKTAGSTPTASQVVTDIQNSWVAAQGNLMASTARLTDVACTPLDGSTATAALPTTALKFYGQISGQPIPAMAAILRLSTALRGARHRGRLYLPFVAEGVQNAGILDSAGASQVQGGWGSFLTALAALAPAYELVVASYVSASAQAVTSYQVEGVAATQRRRQSRLR